MTNLDLSKTPEFFLIPIQERYNKIFKYLISSAYWKKYRAKIFKFDFYQLSFIDKSDIDKIIKYGKITSITNIADLGCGVSEILKYIYNKTNAAIDGFDISDYAINYQKNIITDKIKLNINNLNTINLDKNKYDVIYLIDSHYFIKDKKYLFKKIYDGLTNNGRLILYTQIFDQEKNDLEVDKILIQFIKNIEEIGFKITFKKDLTKKLLKISNKQIKYWNKYKDNLIREIPVEMWDAFNWENMWTKNMLDNNKIKRYFLVFKKR